MAKLLHAAPQRELLFGGRPSRNKLDRRLLRLPVGKLCYENRGVVRATQVLPQPKSIVDNLTFALLPKLAHLCTSTSSGLEAAGGHTPMSHGGRRKNTAASRAGLERLDFAFTSTLGRALVALILA